MYGLTVKFTDQGPPEQWSFWKKLWIYLTSPVRKCRCGRGRHFHWPKSPADTLAEATRAVADAMIALESRHFDPPEGFAMCIRAWPHEGPCAHPRSGK